MNRWNVIMGKTARDWIGSGAWIKDWMCGIGWSAWSGWVGPDRVNGWDGWDRMGRMDGIVGVDGMGWGQME